ncbi:hypothetical protein Cni_G05659 [Canna indica]|uniref:Uncharacterized protein n=1 Tax=Canna indica TaxID=4628 RepID=A0AAQ3JVN2_9LILI|nr:hypothetical protein Cni_G05659 [Canna indica]
MRPLACLGIGLSLVSGFLLLAIVAELYYFFWWKKRKASRGLEEENCTSPVKELLHLFNWKKPSVQNSAALDPQEICVAASGATQSDEEHLHLGSNTNKDSLLDPLEGEDKVEEELMNLAAPPRSLFTITEETQEDLEAADGSHRAGRNKNGSGGMSLRDCLLSAETPVLTPLSSPPLLPQPLCTPMGCYKLNGVNPLFEPSEEDGLTWVWSSPPPKFKFLKDAEEKLYRKTLMEEALRGNRNSKSFEDKDKMEASIIPKSLARTEMEDTRGIPVLCR